MAPCCCAKDDFAIIVGFQIGDLWNQSNCVVAGGETFGTVGPQLTAVRSSDQIGHRQRAIFGRSFGGHVGFPLGLDDNYSSLLRANHSDGVSVTRLAKSRPLGPRLSDYSPPGAQDLQTMKPGISRQTSGSLKT